MSMRRTGIKRTGGPRRHRPLNVRSGKKARRDREFARTRQLVFERDRWRCQRCLISSDWVTLDPHHLDPAGMGGGGDDSMANLVTLCRFNCHRWVHDNVQAAYEQGWLIRSGGGA